MRRHIQPQPLWERSQCSHLIDEEVPRNGRVDSELKPAHLLACTLLLQQGRVISLTLREKKPECQHNQTEILLRRSTAAHNVDKGTWIYTSSFRKWYSKSDSRKKKNHSKKRENGIWSVNSILNSWNQESPFYFKEIQEKNHIRKGWIPLFSLLQIMTLRGPGLRWGKGIMYWNSEVPDLVSVFLLIPSDLEQLTSLGLWKLRSLFFTRGDRPPKGQSSSSNECLHHPKYLQSRNGGGAPSFYLRVRTHHALLQDDYRGLLQIFFPLMRPTAGQTSLSFKHW